MLEITLIPFGYLIGSIPSAYLAGRLLRGVDIRDIGDGNVGTVNAYRSLSPRIGLSVLLADASKGAVVVTVAQIFATQAFVMMAGLAVVLGHIFPFWLAFRGGRGEATTIGVMAVLLPQAMVILAALCTIPFLLTRNTLIAGAILFAPLGLVVWLLGEPSLVVFFSSVLPSIVGVTHYFSTRKLPRVTKKNAALMRWDPNHHSD